jgi:NhaD family Na+/H+ antiporter
MSVAGTALLILAPCPAWAGGGFDALGQGLTRTAAGYLSLFLFLAAYLLVVLEERLELRKSKPVLLAAGLIWALAAVTLREIGAGAVVEEAIRHNLLEYAELFLFLLVAMTYINAMEERNVFLALRSFLVSRRFSLRAVFWLTGFLAFVISPVADNLTTALLMGAVAMAVGGGDRKFVTLACINIVVAANAGGAFSPFGDITTLMVWQKGKVQFTEFFALLLPSLVNWLVPALIMHFAIAKGRPPVQAEKMHLKFGALRIAGLFLCTIATAIFFHNSLRLPAAVGMMLGLGYLGVFSFFIKKREKRAAGHEGPLGVIDHSFPRADLAEARHFDLMAKISRVEWDTLLFFYGVILCVGGLAQFGYLAAVSRTLYHDLGPTAANVMVGLISAVVDNIPVMFAVLTMDPEMPLRQWLLVTLTAGVGGSLLSVGSAAGVALMGTARGGYTFASHLRWTPAIALGYGLSIVCHLLLNP